VRRPWRDFDSLLALAFKDGVEDAGEFGVAVPDQEAEGADPVTEIHEQVTGLLSGPRAIRVAVTPRICTCRVPTSMTNSTYGHLRRIVSTWKKPQARPAACVM